MRSPRELKRARKLQKSSERLDATMTKYQKRVSGDKVFRSSVFAASLTDGRLIVIEYNISIRAETAGATTAKRSAESENCGPRRAEELACFLCLKARTWQQLNTQSAAAED